MTGVLKIPLPVGYVHSFPPTVAGFTVPSPSCRLVRRNFGQGLRGSSATSYWKGARAARSFRRFGLAPLMLTVPLRVAQSLVASVAVSFTGPSNPAQLGHAALMTVDLRFTRGLNVTRSQAGSIVTDVGSTTIVSFAGWTTFATTCAPSAVRKRPTGQGSSRGLRAHDGATRTRTRRTATVRIGTDVSSMPVSGKATHADALTGPDASGMGTP